MNRDGLLSVVIYVVVVAVFYAAVILITDQP